MPDLLQCCLGNGLKGPQKLINVQRWGIETVVTENVSSSDPLTEHVLWQGSVITRTRRNWHSATHAQTRTHTHTRSLASENIQ